MSSLPGGLADPLHLLEPFPWKSLLLAAAIAAFLVWRLVRRRRRAPAAAEAAAAPSAVPPPPGGGLRDQIETLRRRVARSRRFRQGCHELSSLLKTDLERERRRRFSTLTAREIGGALGDTPLSRLFGLLAVLQFGRRAPSGGDFDGVCDLARDVAAGGAPRRSRS